MSETPPAPTGTAPNWLANRNATSEERLAGAASVLTEMGVAPTPPPIDTDGPEYKQAAATLNAHFAEQGTAIAGSEGQRSAVLQWAESNLSAQDQADYAELNADPQYAIDAFRELNRRYLAARRNSL